MYAPRVAGAGDLRARRVELDALAGDELLQSGFWGAFRRRLGWRPLPVAVTGAGAAGTALLLCRRTPAGAFVYCPLGPQTEAPSGASGAYLDRMARAVRPLLPPAGLPFASILRGRKSAGRARCARRRPYNRRAP